MQTAIRFFFRPTRVGYSRSHILDGIRGFAIILMIIFHFCYDLTLFELASIPIYSTTRWIAFRYAIVTLFLATVGASLYIHHQRGINWRTYWRRILLLVFSSLIITLVTWITLKEEYVFFGILHLITLASLLGLIFLHFFWINLVGGIAILWIGFHYSNEAFNDPWLVWMGMLTQATGSSDFTPIFPWFGAVLVGMFIAQLLGNSLYNGTRRQILAPLAFMGRHSLVIYLLHQPILWGLFAFYIYFFA